MTYQNLLRHYAPNANPAGVEAYMRANYGTLDHLPRELFAQEAKDAEDLEKNNPGMLRKISESMGMARDFAMWESVTFK